MKLWRKLIKLTIKIAISQSGITHLLRSFLRRRRLLRAPWGDPPATNRVAFNGSVFLFVGRRLCLQGFRYVMVTIHVISGQSCTVSALWQQSNTVGDVVGNLAGNRTTNRVVNFMKHGLHLGLDMVNRWNDSSTKHASSLFIEVSFCIISLAGCPNFFSKILSKVHEIPLGIHPLWWFQKSVFASILLKVFAILVSAFANVVAIFRINTLRYHQRNFVLILISPSLRIFLGSHQFFFVLFLGTSTIRKYPRFSWKSLCTHLPCLKHFEIVSRLNEVFSYPNSVSRA